MKASSITFVFCLMFTGTAYSDWVKLGVASRCEGTEFTVISTAETSSPEYNVNAPDGFANFGKGADQHYKCTLNGVAIEMTINVYGPQARGMGQGAGVIIIDSLTVGDKHLIDMPTNFNWQVLSERVLTRIHVAKQAGIYAANLCYSNGWDWDAPFQDEQCKRTVIGVESNDTGAK